LEQLELKATLRKKIGKGPARALRRDGMIPAVLYGPETEPMLLAVDITELEQIVRKHNIQQVLLNLVIKNGKTVTKPVMIKELQTNPVLRNFLHADFYEIAMDRKIKVNIPVTTTGVSESLAQGGVLQIVRRELEVFCLPGKIPESVEIDITDLEIGDSVHVEDIPLKGDIEISADVNFTVLTILTPKIEVLEAEEEEEAAEAEEEAAAEEEGEEASEAEPEE
jgi:large subunit ribosomal protein L25